MTLLRLASSIARPLPSMKFDLSDESRDELVRLPLVDLDRASDLFDQAVPHDDQAVGNGHGLEHVMRYKDGCDVELLLEFPDLLAHDWPQVCIERIFLKINTLGGFPYQ